MGELIAVLSGKGGTGKTSVCAGIASALAQRKKKVLCIDCDVGLRNLDIALAIRDLGALSFLEVCRGDYSLEQAAVHPEYPDLHFLTAPIGCRAEDVNPESFHSLLQQARARYDFVFLDAPAGVEQGFYLAARYVDRVLLVTGPDPASIRDASRAAQLLEQLGKQNVRLIVNRISHKTAKAMGLTVDDIMDQAGLPLIGVVPEDGNVVLAAAFEKPLLHQTGRGAAAACKRIAKRLEGYWEPVAL